MMGVLLDHLMLAECDFVVWSESSFGRTVVGVGMRSSKTYTFGKNCSSKLKQHLYLKKAGLASRNIVHLQNIILRCVGFCFCILHLYVKPIRLLLI